MKEYGTSSMFSPCRALVSISGTGLDRLSFENTSQMQKRVRSSLARITRVKRTEPFLLKPYLAFGVKLSRATSLVEILICWLTERPMEMASDSMNTAALANSSLLMSYDESVGEV